MVQILESNRKPTFGQKLGAGVGRGLEIGKELMGKYQQQQKEQLDRSQRNNQFKSLTGLEGEGFDPDTQRKIIELQMQGKNAEAKELLKQSGAKTLQEQQFNFDKQLQENAPPKAADLKFQREEEDSKRVRETGQKSFNGLVGLLKKGNVGYGSGAISMLPGTGKTQEDIGKFSTLTGGLESMLVDMVSRGTLSNTRFKYITETLLPKPGDRQEIIRGKLKGLAEILGLDASALGIKSSNQPKEMNNNENKPSLSSFMRE